MVAILQAQNGLRFWADTILRSVPIRFFVRAQTVDIKKAPQVLWRQSRP